jgi:hypothetical protein
LNSLPSKSASLLRRRRWRSNAQRRSDFSRERRLREDPLRVIKCRAQEASISPNIRTTLRRASGCIVNVDDVGPIVASFIAVAEQLRGDGVAVGLVVDQNVAEMIPGRRAESTEEITELGVPVAHVRGRFNASRAASTDA